LLDGLPKLRGSHRSRSQQGNLYTLLRDNGFENTHRFRKGIGVGVLESRPKIIGVVRAMD
jgi:hypothetical protein